MSDSDDLSELMELKKIVVTSVFEMLNDMNLSGDEYATILANMTCDLTVIMTQSLKGTKKEKQDFLVDYQKLVTDTFNESYDKSQQTLTMMRVLRELKKKYEVGE